MNESKIDFDASGLDWKKVPLVPAIVQHCDSAQVLMLGYMSPEALDKTCSTGLVTFYSRSRQTLWTKGETSGNVLRCKAIYADCDGDTLLISAAPAGPTCHRNTLSCFDEPPRSSSQFLGELEQTIRARLTSAQTDSYVASLAAHGIERIAQKVGEEGVEVAIAAVTGRTTETLSEAADLLFHLMVLVNHQGMEFADVVAELKNRSTG